LGVYQVPGLISLYKVTKNDEDGSLDAVLLTQLKIIHSDLKPENILLLNENSDEIKVKIH